MTMLWQRAKEIPNYVRSQGLLPGVRLWMAMLRMRWSTAGSLHRLYIPSLDRKIALRNHESDLSILFQVIVKREYGFDDFPQAAALRREYERIVAAGRAPLIIDAGGNAGFAAAYFAQCFPRALIVSIEPDPANAAILKENIANVPAAEVLVAGLWDRKTHLRIVDTNAGPGGIRVVEDDTKSTGIPTVTIDEILALHADCVPFILKIDIEGAEEIVFRSDAEWLSRFSLVAIELHDWLFPGKGTSRNFLRSVAGASFDVLISGENLLCFAIPEADAPARKAL